MNPNQVDNDVVNLAKAIRQQESGGDFTSKEGSSGEMGAYQFMPDTWNAYSNKYGIHVPLKDATKDQQNAVAYNKIKEWKDAGYNVTQIASMWNAGEGEPNAYKGTFEKDTSTHKAGDPSKGKRGDVSYDVPAHAANVGKFYLDFKNGISPQTPSSSVEGGQKNMTNYDTTDPNSPYYIKPAEKKTPTIVEQPRKTNLQKAGEFGAGVLKGGIETLAGSPFATFGITGLNKPVGERQGVKDILAAKTKYEKVGKTAEKIGEALLPLGAEKTISTVFTKKVNLVQRLEGALDKMKMTTPAKKVDFLSKYLTEHPNLEKSELDVIEHLLNKYTPLMQKAAGTYIKTPKAGGLMGKLLRKGLTAAGYSSPIAAYEMYKNYTK